MEYTQREFFDAVLPAGGLVAVGRLAPEKGSAFKHDIYSNVDDMLDGLASAKYNTENHYFAISTFVERSVVERGKARFRTQTNARLTRCFVLDLDVKNDEAFYNTKDEAWEGLQRVTMQLNLPDPIVVDSGYGYHVYWPMVAGIPSKEWQAVAKLFYQALSIIEPKSVADSSRVSDTAGVLRIPESYNLKNKQLTPVGIVQWTGGMLDFGEFRDMLRRVTGRSEDMPTVNLVVGNQTYEKVALLPTIKNCNWAKDYMLNAATASEPAWYAMLGLAPFMEHIDKQGQIISGVNIAHILSKQHPDYTHDSTATKFNQVQHGQTGPTTCAKFEQINSKPCQTCPFRGAVKSPVQTARLDRPATEDTTILTIVTTDTGNKQEEEVTIPRPPSPYFRGESGGVYLRAKEKQVNDDKSETWNEVIHKVYDYDLYPVKRFRSELMEEEQIEIHLWLPKDGMRRFKMPTEVLSEHKKLSTFLTSRGAIAETGSSPRIAKYMVDYARHMQTEASAEVEYTRFGWRDVTGAEPKFIVGNGIIGQTGEVLPAAFPSYLRESATAVASHGTLEAWRAAFNVYNAIPDSDAFIFTACMGFAAPLMALTPYAGVLFNMVGKSGAGKSAALALMCTVWGMPMPNRIKVTDTQIARDNKIGYLNSVPVAFDEVTTMDAQVASEFALNFTGGRGKDRAGRDGQNRENHVTWDTIVVCTSNTSMYTKFTAARKGYNAEAMRLFEVNVPKSHDMYKSMMDRAQAAIKENYGHAGRLFIPIVMRNREVITRAIDLKANEILGTTGGSNSERFWAVLAACWHIGNTIAVKKGLHHYDVEAITSWVMGQMHVARENTGSAAADPRAMLGEFINASLDSMVRVRDGAVVLDQNIHEPRSIKGRLEYEGAAITRAIVSAKALTDFCNRSNIDSSWLITELTRAGVTDGVSRPSRLATGTNYPNATVRAYHIDFGKQTEDTTNEQ